ncbi:MAG: hypothetical protein AAFX06_28975 [Planctomycetota bacterium]
MATFFLANAEQLSPAFPDWKEPLPEPVARTTLNPYTREEITITTRAPEWDDFDPEMIEFEEPRVVAIEGDYQDFLENRLPPFVQAQPHWCSKNLTNVEVDPLITVVAGSGGVSLETALYAPPALGCCLETFPDAFVEAIPRGGDGVTAIADKWAKAMSHRDYTHNRLGERVMDDWTTDQALSILNPIVDLLQQRTGRQSLHLLVEG